MDEVAGHGADGKAVFGKEAAAQIDAIEIESGLFALQTGTPQTAAAMQVEF